MRNDFTTLLSGDGYRQVKDIDELDSLIKEHELLMSRPGRVFYIRSRDRAFRIDLVPEGYQIRQLWRRPRCAAIFVGRRELNQDLVGCALRHGFLFTERLQA